MPSVDDVLAAIQAKDTPAIARMLEQDPSLAHGRRANGDSVLLLAAYHHAKPIVDLFLAKGARPNVWEAAAVGRLDRVRELVNSRPELLNAYSHDGWTPLHLAGHFGQKDVAAFLLSKGADVNARSKNALNNTPLHAAVAGSQRTVVAMLLQQGAEVDATYEEGRTALFVAAFVGDEGCARLLLQAKARKDIADKEGKTPAAIAKEKGHERVLRLLETGR